MTSRSEKALKILFCEYKRRRKSGLSIDSSSEFDDGQIPALRSFRDWSSNDLTSALDEMQKSGYISINIIGDVRISSAGIAFMEEKQLDFFRDIAHLFDLEKILDLIP